MRTVIETDIANYYYLPTTFAARIATSAALSVNVPSTISCAVCPTTSDYTFPSIHILNKSVHLPKHGFHCDWYDAPVIAFARGNVISSTWWALRGRGPPWVPTVQPATMSCNSINAAHHAVMQYDAKYITSERALLYGLCDTGPSYYLCGCLESIS